MNSTQSSALTVDTAWRSYSPVGLRLLDESTGDAPLGRIAYQLFVSRGPNQWEIADEPAVWGSASVLMFPGLGRSVHAAGAAVARRYRITIDAEFYLPFYAAQTTGFEFDVWPFNDAAPPRQITRAPQSLVLVPSPDYPFPPYVRVLRGDVRNGNGPVAYVEVARGNVERVLTDEHGCYALPLRLAQTGSPLMIDALDHRSGLHGHIVVTLPADLRKNNPIVIG